MRYLRMLTNAAVAGALGAAFVVVLVFQLNPQLPLTADVLMPLYRRLLAFYGTHLAVLFYALIVLRQLLARDVLSPGWLSVRLLAWMTALLAGGAAVLMWLNLSGFRRVIDREAARRMAAGAAATAVCALLLFLIAVVHYSFGRRGSRTAGTLFAATTACALVLPAVARGAGELRGRVSQGVLPTPVLEPSAVTRRLFMILLDGASLEYIAPATAEGRLPHFGRLLDAGASMHLSTIRPTQPAVVWAAAATGKYPPANGVRSSATYGFGHRARRLELLPDLVLANALVSLGLLDERENDAGALRARPLWDILSAQGISVGVVGWPPSDPVRPVRGYLVSDRVHRASRTALPLEDPSLVYPADAFTRTPVPPWPATPVGGSPPTSRDGSLPAGSEAIEQRGLLPRDAWYARIAQSLYDRYQPRVAAMRFEGIDAAGHHYLRYAMPRAFGDVSEDERQRHGQVLERQYAYIDDRIGSAMDALGPDDVLMVVSGFGMEPVTIAKRILARTLQEADLTGTHERAPDGFLLAYGGPVVAGRLPLGSIVDVTPSVLYLLGLPVGRDMDGYARTDLFERSFTAERPIAFIPSYD